MRTIRAHFELGDEFGSPPIGRGIRVVLDIDGEEIRPEVWSQTRGTWGDRGHIVIIRYGLPADRIDTQSLRRAVADFFGRAIVEFEVTGKKSVRDLLFLQKEPFDSWHEIMAAS